VQALTQAKAESLGYKAHTCLDRSAFAPASPPARSRTPSDPKPAAVTVWVSSTSNKYHRAECRLLGSNPRSITLEAAGKQYWPCPQCRPPIRPRDVKGIEVMNWKKKKPS
jgi:hypothetical protein